MDSLIEALTTSSRIKGGQLCTVLAIRRQLTDGQRDALDAEIDAIRRSRVHGVEARHTAASLARLLTDHGHTVSTSAMQSHVAGRCRCGG